MPNQYEKVFIYDMQISLKDTLEDGKIEELITLLEQKEEIEKVGKFYMTSSSLVKNEHTEDAQIIVPKAEEDLNQIINLTDINSKEKINMKDNEICLTDKAAQLLGVKAGDTIILKDSDNNEIEVKISNIVENYVSHYVFMNKKTYENIFKEQYKTNVLFTKNVELSGDRQDELASEIMNRNEIGRAHV